MEDFSKCGSSTSIHSSSADCTSDAVLHFSVLMCNLIMQPVTSYRCFCLLLENHWLFNEFYRLTLLMNHDVNIKHL